VSVTIARLHLITPDAWDRWVIEQVDAALEAGAPWVQVRSKRATDRQRGAFAGAVARSCAASGATCVIDDRADVALAVGAAGVHLGADDLPVAAVRTLLGPAAVIGATCRHPDDARRAVDDGASYLGVGPVFATTTKVGLPDPIGLAGLEAVATAVELPVVAISGITLDRVASVRGAGAHGVAVVAAVFDAPDVGEATRAFLDALGAAPVRPGSAWSRP
jgi:thiamine-phosphate pyrophosphorylase